MTEFKGKTFGPIALLLVALLVAGLATSSASAGAGGPSASVAKKKKKCKPGFVKQVVKKHGKKKNRCVPVTPTVPAPKLEISPASFAFPDTQHGMILPCSSCPTQAFTVTNTGGASSGTLGVTITELTQPVIGAHDPGYYLGANTCSAALPPGGSCSATVQFRPPSNAGDGNYTSALHVTGTPGGDVSATVSGHST